MYTVCNPLFVARWPPPTIRCVQAGSLDNAESEKKSSRAATWLNGEKKLDELFSEATKPVFGCVCPSLASDKRRVLQQ